MAAEVFLRAEALRWRTLENLACFTRSHRRPVAHLLRLHRPGAGGRVLRGGGAMGSEPRPDTPAVKADRLRLPSLRGGSGPPGLGRCNAGVGVVRPSSRPLHRKKVGQPFKIKSRLLLIWVSDRKWAHPISLRVGQVAEVAPPLRTCTPRAPTSKASPLKLA